MWNNGAWILPGFLKQHHPDIEQRVQLIEFSEEDEDSIQWVGSDNGELTVKQAFNHYREKGTNISWMSRLWTEYIPPKLSFLAWRIIKKRVQTANRLVKTGMQIGRVCLRCVQGFVEDEKHIFWECHLAMNLWCWVSHLIGEDLNNFDEPKKLFAWAAKLPKKKQCSQVILSLVLCRMWELWYCRNMLVFQQKLVTLEQCVSNVRAGVKKLSFMFNGTTENIVEQLQLLRFFSIIPKFRGGVRVIEVIWYRPPPVWYEVNIDGAAKGQPGIASCGGIFRNYRGFCLGCFAMPLGAQIAIFVEIMGFIWAVEFAMVKGWFPLWIETDSKILLHKVKTKSDDVPWKIKLQWRRRGRRVNMKKEIVLVLLVCFQILNSEAAFSTVTSVLEKSVITKVLKNELEVAAPAERVWGVYRSPALPSLLPRLLPGVFEKIEVVSGDGGNGTILHLTFPPGQIPHEVYEQIVEINNRRLLKKVQQIKGGYLDMNVTYYQESYRVVSTGPYSCGIRSYITYRVKKELAGKVEPLITIDGPAALAKAIAKFVLGGIAEI